MNRSGSQTESTAAYFGLCPTTLVEPCASGEDGRLIVPLILFVGRFVEKKGIDIVRALSLRICYAQWVMAGWGPEDPSRWDIPNLTCVGRQHQDELAELSQAADLLVLPSSGEGFPLVVYQSMSCGTPVAVATETARAYPGVSNFRVVRGTQRLRFQRPTHNAPGITRDDPDTTRAGCSVCQTRMELGPLRGPVCRTNQASRQARIRPGAIGSLGSPAPAQSHAAR